MASIYQGRIAAVVAFLLPLGLAPSAAYSLDGAPQVTPAVAQEAQPTLTGVISWTYIHHSHVRSTANDLVSDVDQSVTGSLDLNLVRNVQGLWIDDGQSTVTARVHATGHTERLDGSNSCDDTRDVDITNVPFTTLVDEFDGPPQYNVLGGFPSPTEVGEEVTMTWHPSDTSQVTGSSTCGHVTPRLYSLTPWPWNNQEWKGSLVDPESLTIDFALHRHDECQTNDCLYDLQVQGHISQVASCSTTGEPDTAVQPLAAPSVDGGACDADVSVTASDNPDPTTSSIDVTLTLVVTNNGPAIASSVQLNHTLPAGVVLRSATSSQGACNLAAQTTCEIGSLASGASATVNVVIQATRDQAGTSLASLAAVSARESDPNMVNNTAATNTLIRGCAANELSGAQWAGVFPTSQNLADLAPGFQANVRAFINAMQVSGINVGIVATLRPAQRAYLMHYSWLIANRGLDPAVVPAFIPAVGQASVDICWVHRTAGGAIDRPASVAAAQGLSTALGIDPNLALAPALNSRHTEGRAIDMTTTWGPGRMRVLDAQGRGVQIPGQPRNGLNAQLIAVGATYGVVHFLAAAADPNHWSTDGR
jgi:uncharacterized repeat protein (TIGR01451 family)